MKRALLLCLGMGVGWIVAATLLIIALPYGKESFGELFQNYFVFGFPGLLLLIVSVILALIYPEGLEGDEY